MVTPAHCRNYFKKSPFFLPGAASEYLTRTLYTPSAQDLGHFPAQQAVGNPFRAGNDTFFCLEPPRGTFRAGIGVLFCPGGGWCPIPRRICRLFLPQIPSTKA